MDAIEVLLKVAVLLMRFRFLSSRFASHRSYRL